MPRKKAIDKTITIGSDPEFVMVNKVNDTMINGWEFFRDRCFNVCLSESDHTCYNKRHCPVVNPFCGHYTRSPEIGSDGSLCEIRPKASEFPLQHVEEIGKLLHKLNDFKPHNYIMRGGTVQQGTYGFYGYASIGGHIHIGINENNWNSPFSKTRLGKYLSYYCGIPLKKIEHMNEIHQRGWNQGTYGYYGLFYPKPYGIEWRMPASWLVSKEIATSSLCLAYTVAKEFLVDRKSFVNLTEHEYHDLLNSNIKPIIKRIEKMQYYKYYRKEIDTVLDMVREGKEWDTTNDIMKHW